MGPPHWKKVPPPTPPEGCSVAAAQDDPSPADRPGVLIVDDERLLRTLLQVALERQGLRVFLAGDGPEAIALFREHHRQIALVVTEVLLPGMSGFEAAAALRQINPAVRLCFMTADISFSIETEALAGGASVLHKPFPLPETAQRLAQLAHGEVKSILA